MVYVYVHLRLLETFGHTRELARMSDKRQETRGKLETTALLLLQTRAVWDNKRFKQLQFNLAHNLGKKG